MDIEIIWTTRLMDEKHIREKLKKDFVSYETKPTDDGRILVFGDNKLLSHGGKDWMAFEPNEDEDVIYFEKGFDMSWMVTPVVDEMYKRMRNEKSRAFAGNDINQIISYISKCLSGTEWKPQIKKEEK